ncbi:MAG: hypothetical protein KatS3mg073_1438 [Meiothermus sp.]|nr:MAG: hypothetical protein KatS3mg073_1438 [Meiothermus sp.]
MQQLFPDQRQPAPLTLAARTNLWPLTALGYEIWRKRALSLLSGRHFPLEEEFDLMRQRVGPVEGRVFLDLGTSTGLYARALLEAGAARVYALDLSPAMLKVACRRPADMRVWFPCWPAPRPFPCPRLRWTGWWWGAVGTNSPILSR